MFTEWEQACTRISTDNYVLNCILETSMLDLRSLMQQEPQGLVVTAGLPWYFTLFGRDSIITALETLMLNPQIAVDTLRALAAYQATEVDDWRDSEPGKILHELRRGDMALAGEVPHSPYYGSVDSTLLYMMLFAETVKWTNSQALFDELWDSVRKALDWAWQWGDADGDGYVEFSRRSNRGIRHQGWKDSDELIGGVVGPRPKPPIALVEVQGYYYAALTGVAEALRRYGNGVEEQAKGGLADKLEKQAAKLKAQFNRDYWSEATGFYVHALDGSKAQVPDVTSNVGHCLWTGIVDEARAGQVVAKLMQPDMLSGWGVRTMSAEDVTYNPMSYHNGSIWPHDNAVLVAGLRRYNFGAEMVQVATEVLDAAATFEGYRLPELYCGFARGEGIDQESAPAAYPVSCSPQAWAAGTPLLMLQALLGVDIDAEAGTISTSPMLPPDVKSVQLQGMNVMGTPLDVDIRLEGSGGGHASHPYSNPCGRAGIGRAQFKDGRIIVTLNFDEAQGDNKRLFAATGRRAFLIGSMHGGFPMGHHLPGEMGGLWAFPVKLADGFWFGLSKGDASAVQWMYGEACTGSYMRPGEAVREYGLAVDGLNIEATQQVYVPDEEPGVVINLTLRNAAQEAATFGLQWLVRWGRAGSVVE